jgi:quercetin dioxygenase-like cupin family protein
MTIVRKTPNFIDERGQITDIIENQPFDSLTILTTSKGAIRGNHFHKLTTQYAYILEGSFNYYSKSDDGAIKLEKASKGDMVISLPMEQHAFEAIEDSVMLAFCLGPRAGAQYETDTYRLETPLCSPTGLQAK